MGKPTMWFPNRSDTNQAVQSQKQARSLNFRILEEEELYYPCSENKDADQLCSYRGSRQLDKDQIRDPFTLTQAGLSLLHAGLKQLSCKGEKPL